MPMLQMVKGFLGWMRLSPAVSWVLGAFAISAGFAVHNVRTVLHVHWEMLGVILLSSVLLQAVFKAREGAVQAGAEIRRTWFLLSLFGLVATITFGEYAAASRAASVLLILLLGVFSTLAYTFHPLRHVPLLSEWLATFPAVVACTLGTYFLLTDSWEPIVGIAAVLHSMLCVAWLVQGHLEALEGKEREKTTTVAWVARRFGPGAARHVPAGYFLLTSFVGTLVTLKVAHVFLLTVLCSLLGAFHAWNTKPEQVADHQIRMLAVIVLHAVVLSLWVAWT
jgi:1,4-dihydroxy-2-naphthoate octaprenyltransferase